VETDLDLVEHVAAFGARELRLLRPRSAEALLDEQAFEREEFRPYWAELWSSGETLAEAVAGRALDGVQVLELGAGLGLPSLAAALGGARVLATDWSPDAVALLRENAQRNGLALETRVVRWDEPAPFVTRAPWELVLAADVLYERRNVDELLELLPRLVDEGEVLVADPGRPHANGFFERAAETWTVEERGVIRSLRRRG
jgi:predicted nicotinamide N-methyase